MCVCVAECELLGEEPCAGADVWLPGGVMTSEATRDEARKRRLRVVAFLQRHKRKIGCIILAGLVIMLLGVAAPSHTIISCHDPSIRRELRKETIPVSTLFILAFLVPFIVMILVEWLVPPDTPSSGRKVSPLRASLRRSWSHLGDLFVGGVFMYFITDLLKTIVGEARPNFWATCKPNLTEEECTHEYITVTWRDCTNPYNLKQWKLAETMKSFPSGHASISVFSTIFMLAYIHKRLWQRCSSFLSPWLQLLWLLWALVCCQSRVWDNKHFWWDVLGGAVIGAVFAFLTLHYLANWFERLEDTTLVSPKKDNTSPPRSSSSSYIQEEEEEEGDNSSRFSRTSIKRLITAGGGEEGEGGGGGDRELRNITSAP